MHYDVQVKEVPPQQVAAVRKRVTMEEIGGGFVPDAFRRIGMAIDKAGLAPTGMPFAIYHTMDPAAPEWDVEICFPVTEPFPGDGEVYGTVIEGATVAWTIHRGPYEELGPAYETLTAWVAEEGRRFAGPPRELYLNDPRQSGPENTLTEIDWPIT